MPTTKGVGIALVIIGCVLGIWAYAWGHTGYYDSQAGALAFLGLLALAALVGGGILFNRARAAERLESSQGVSISRPETEEVPAPVTSHLVEVPLVEPFLIAAANPLTAQARLAELAWEQPQTRVAVAGNPAAYPALLEWLAQLDDPEVNAALAARSG